MAAQNQPPPPNSQAAVTSEVTTPVSTVAFGIPSFSMPEGWGPPFSFGTGFRHNFSGVQTATTEAPAAQGSAFIPHSGVTFSQITMALSQPTMTVPTPTVHTVPYDGNEIYHDQGDSTNPRNLVEDLQEQFNKIQLEVKAIRGKDLFGKNAQELCLVPSVQIPAKFKVPDFEKYKGSSCPQSHLVMYARKMSTYADNHQLLIHYFQDSLTGAALKWYTGLDSTNIRTFNDLGEAFVRQYKYNSDMAPDRDQLRSMAQKDHEAFKEYAQRWRETAAQINPPLKEKEMTKIFLNTLSPFYYERMIASAPSDFTEMVNMGMRLEEGVRTGRLTKEGGSSSGTKKFGSGFPKKYKIVDQLMQTPSKISILSLLLNSEAHREALMRVLDQAFVDHDVTVDHFDGIIANITACNNLSFCDEELPEEGKNHNLALHISMNCQSDSLSNVLVDTGSSLNVMPKTTLARLSYQGMPMKFSGVVVKAFDGSRKSVIGEVNLPMTIGPHTFQITFQVMDIQAAYSCLLGRPWIHEAGAVTSTLHQKLKFVTNGKLVTISGEQALMVSHLSNFSFISADDVEGTQFQGLSLEDESSKKKASISSYKEAVKVVRDGTTTGWGQVVIPTKNETRAGLGC
ncbi:uncharacterized protein LOC131649006, partial [Vicia villosa]|uniref:uncharacterized protein LOC131649006 n=1 Tax=Vicia villosa TaxID=3911 RepID=UPI00273AE623